MAVMKCLVRPRRGKYERSAPLWIGFRFGRRRSIAGASVSPLQSASSICCIGAIGNRGNILVRRYEARYCGSFAFVIDPGFIVEGATSSLSRGLYNLVLLLFAVMIWLRRLRDVLE